MATRQFRVNLSQKDSEYLKEIAKELDLTDSEVIRKGLKLMALYAKTETEEDTQLIAFCMSRKRVSRRNPFSVRYSTNLGSDPDALPFDDDWENAEIISPKIW